LSLCGATVATFVLSRWISGAKFEISHVQNATLAGGVVMGVVADLRIHFATAVGMGMLAGVISTLGFAYLTPLLNNKLRIQDICGINNLHGMPGLLGAVLSVFVTLVLSKKNIGWFRTESAAGVITVVPFPRGDKQPGYQLLGVIVCLAMAVVGGIIAGFLMKLAKRLHVIFAEDYFNDRGFWNLPSDYDNVVRPDPEDEREMSAITAAAYPDEGNGSTGDGIGTGNGR